MGVVAPGPGWAEEGRVWSVQCVRLCAVPEVLEAGYLGRLVLLRPSRVCTYALR